MIREKRNYISQNLIVNKNYILLKEEILSESEKEEERIKKKSVRNLLRKKDQELREKEIWEKYMVCPDCHLSLPRSGICDCGYSI